MKRPYIIINCAMSADGKIALPSRTQIRLSSEEDIKRVYNLRHTCDAVLVGIETVLSDNPKLTVKEKYVKNPNHPLRVVLDSKGRTPQDALVVDDAAPTLIFTTKGYEKQYPGENVEVYSVPADPSGRVDLAPMLEVLSLRGITTVLVEGGGTIIWNFLKQRFMDDLYVYISPCIIGGAKTPTVADGEGINSEDAQICLQVTAISRLGSGLLLHYKMIP